MNSRPKFQRRNYFINKDFQSRYIFKYFILTLIGSAYIIGVFSFFSSNTLSIVYDNYNLQPGVTPGTLFEKILSTQWLFLIVGGGAVIIITLFLSHRIAGPFFRFERALDEMIEGNLSSKIILRRKDEGTELAQKINVFNEKFAKNLTAVENFNSDIAVAIQHLKEKIEHSIMDNQDFFPLITEIQDKQKNIQTMINDCSFFKGKP